MRKNKLIVVCGPTATGKTKKGIELGKERNGEVVSADSRQVYEYLDIGTAKVTLEEKKGIPHHMIDIVEPKERYTVAQYKKDAKQMIHDIYKRNKTPILVGGTGMYIDAVVYDQNFPEVPPNHELREKLKHFSLEKLQETLKELDQDRYETIDENNPVRLIRAIEIAEAIGKVPKNYSSHSPYILEIHYMDLPDGELKANIHERNTTRVNNGLIEEVKNLHDTHRVSWARLYELGLEYRYVSQYIQGEIETIKELVEILDTKIWQLVTHQRTWFRKYKS